MYEINTKTEDTYLYDPWGLYGGLIMEFEVLSEVYQSAKPRNRPWTETVLKYFAVVLADEKHEFSYKLYTLALKKTANKTVFEDIKKAFEDRMSSEVFKQENKRENRGSKSKKDLPPLEVDS